MAPNTFTNPVAILEGHVPATGDIPQLQADGTWTTTSAASVGVLVVPQTHVADPTAAAAQTGVTNSTAAAATQSGSYVQADVQTIATLANALKTQGNANQVDIASLYTALTAFQALFETLVDELETAGILS